MDSATRQLIEAIHCTSCQIVLAVTGGGTGAVAQLLAVPGGSRTILEAVVPYGEEALIEFLGRQPESYCSAATSRDMAARAYDRASWLAERGSSIPAKIVGLACTASLATDRPKKGEHRFYITALSAEGFTTYSLTLCKGARDRQAEELVLDAVLLNALAEAVGVETRLPAGLLPAEKIQTESQRGTDLLNKLLRGDLAAISISMDGRFESTQLRPAALLPGAFKPIHEGHWGLAKAASRLTGLSVDFELSVTNVDKPPLEADEIRRRLHQFTWRSPVWLTRAATFAEKAALFPGALFVVGADTVERLVAPRYYQDSKEKMAQALDYIRKQGNRFLVAGRVGQSEQFTTLSGLALPEAYRDLFAEIPEAEFRANLSSTNLREQADKDPNADLG
jgi:hypothetical protein